MLENREPFKSMLKFYHLCGLWEVDRMKLRHRIAAKITFVLLKELPFVLAVLSLLQDKTAYEYNKSATVILSSIMNSGYIMTFMLLKKQIQALFKDFNRTLDSRPDSERYLIDELQQAEKLERRKVVGIVIWVLMAVVSTFIVRDVSVQMWQPEFLRNRADFFYVLWSYQSLHIVYLAFVALFMQDFFFTCLRVINALMKHLRDELRALDLNGSEGRKKIVNCVEIHRDIRAMMGKFTRIASIPMGIHMLVGAYILCTAAIVVSSDNNEDEVGSFVGLCVITSMQLFYPCLIAQEIESASMEMMNSIAESDWLRADLNTKKLMLIFMQNLSKPVVKLNLFTIVDINLGTFLRVVNATFSAYAVLNNMRK